jgi:hypothetical protein
MSPPSSEEDVMPEKKTLERAKKAKREGKAPSTQAGEFIREEIHHIREGKHGAASTRQAIAIGLSKARRAGVKLAAPKRGSKRVRRQAKRDLRRGKSRRKPNPSRSRASTRALRRKPRKAASHRALSRHAKRSTNRRAISRGVRRANAKRNRASR